MNEDVFKLNPNVKFGILIGRNIKNSETKTEDEERLRSAEEDLRRTYQPDQVRELANIASYRDLMRSSGINPNKFPSSVEAMVKRILKGGQLPTINALVDLCNAVSIENIISLGAHDLADIHEDLVVRYSRKGDQFLPFGAMEYEDVQEGELVFTSGNKVQTRKWIWRQSELGKTTLDSRHIFFQLVGFEDGKDSSLKKAMAALEQIIVERFGGDCEKSIVDPQNPMIEFSR